MKWPPFFISYFDSSLNARLRGNKHNPRNWVFPTVKVKKPCAERSTCRSLGLVDRSDATFKSVCSIRTDERIVKPSKGLLLQTLWRTKSVLSKKLYLLKGLIVLKPKNCVILSKFLSIILSIIFIFLSIFSLLIHNHFALSLSPLSGYSRYPQKTRHPGSIYFLVCFTLAWLSLGYAAFNAPGHFVFFRLIFDETKWLFNNEG